MNELIDLKWDPVNLDIVFDEYRLDHVLTKGVDAISQSIDISLRFNPNTIRLINCDESDVQGLLRNIREDLEDDHAAIILGSIRLSFDYTERKMTGEYAIQYPGREDLTKYIEMELV